METARRQLACDPLACRGAGRDSGKYMHIMETQIVSSDSTTSRGEYGQVTAVVGSTLVASKLTINDCVVRTTTHQTAGILRASCADEFDRNGLSARNVRGSAELGRSTMINANARLSSSVSCGIQITMIGILQGLHDSMTDCLRQLQLYDVSPLKVVPNSLHILPLS